MYKIKSKIITIFLIACSTISLISCSNDNAQKQQTAVPPSYVSTSTVNKVSYRPFVESVGRLEPNRKASLGLDGSGIVNQIHFHSGEFVKEGTVLITLDHELQSARLQSLESEFSQAKHQYQRLKKLHRSKSIASSELEKARTEYIKAQTALGILKTEIAHKELKAPFSGKLGFKQVETGEYITPGKTVVKILSLNPMRVEFSIPEQYFPYVRLHQKIQFTTEAYPEKSFAASISAIDIETTDISHLIKVEGSVDNHDDLLYPGLFTKLKLFYKPAHDVLTIPRTAINYNLYGNSVYTVNCKTKPCKAQEKFVTVGPSIGDDVIILKGLNENEQVISSGQLKVHNHSPIIINNEGESDVKKDKNDKLVEAKTIKMAEIKQNQAN